ncbi:Zinc finger C2H2 [Penicillium solitum]|uniref:Zinc finger C2H2 n=1 Tax=Penicillium solitum TaxID=60172 RepID=UPI0032C408F2|nr:Zinc finger C2H2 [Penicillium solitum]
MDSWSLGGSEPGAYVSHLQNTSIDLPPEPGDAPARYPPTREISAISEASSSYITGEDQQLEPSTAESAYLETSGISSSALEEFLIGEGGMNGGDSSTNLASNSGAVNNTNNDEPATHDAETKGGWESEEAEMPSEEVIAPSPHDGLYYCQYVICQQRKGYALKCQLTKHIRTHVLPVKCSECPYAAAEKKDVDRHVKAAHRRLAEQTWGPMEPILCALCKKEFTRRDNAQKHYKTKHIR